MAKVLITFKEYSNDELDNKTRDIITSMTANANFATPNPTLSTVQTALTEFQDAVAQASKGGVDKTALRRQKRKTLEDTLRGLAVYVNSTTDNEVILISSGFDLMKVPAKIGQLEKPDGFKVENGVQPGSIKVLCNAVPGAGSYLAEYTLMPATDNSKWDREVSTARTITITGLQRGKEYAFRIAGVGAHTDRVFSDVISKFVQ
jgi:hypothetical protein